MDLKLSHDTIEVSEVLFDAMVEQSINIDCQLPDYCPNVFKILKCKMVPAMTSSQCTGNELLLDGTAVIFIVYLCEETNQIRSFSQKVPFTKTVELKGASVSPVIDVSMFSEYLNCRGVNPRRFDIRGAIGINIKVTEQKQLSYLAGADGGGIQKKTAAVKLDGECKQATKQFTVREELELPDSNSEIASILYHHEAAEMTDIKVIAGKVIVKGDVSMTVVYSPIGDGKGPESMEYSLPVSQIVDVPGIDDSYESEAMFHVATADLEPKVTVSGEARLISAELSVFCKVNCIKEEEKSVITDLYSTDYACDPEQQRMPARKTALLPAMSTMVQTSVDVPGDDISKIYDIWCDIARLSVKTVSGQINLDGEFDICAIGVDMQGMPVSVDKRSEFHGEVDRTIEHEEGITIVAEATVRSVSYHMTGDHKIDLRVEVVLHAKAVQTVDLMMVTDLSLDESKATSKADLAALTLYFADEGERIWDIAKRYHTSVSAILEENDLEDEVMRKGGMILIPLDAQ